MLSKLYLRRFEIFFISQMAILFGSLLVPSAWFENVLSPILFQINLLAGILMISKKRKLMWFFVILLIITAVISGSSIIENTDEKLYGFMRMGTYFLFYVMVSLEIIKQVWKSEKINENVILGLISGYVSLGLIGFFICISIEMANPNSFQGLAIAGTSPNILTDRLMYYSYITLLTIGYGDIIPVTALAQKATILIGLIGQFYLVILTATIVGKYISQFSQSKPIK